MRLVRDRCVDLHGQYLVARQLSHENMKAAGEMNGFVQATLVAECIFPIDICQQLRHRLRGGDKGAAFGKKRRVFFGVRRYRASVTLRFFCCILALFAPSLRMELCAIYSAALFLFKFTKWHAACLSIFRPHAKGKPMAILDMTRRSFISSAIAAPLSFSGLAFPKLQLR